LRHFLAYGNSDQVSFRDPEVRKSFSYMTVPGTIAAYYSEATAAFVLASGLDYLIDPRTPLFQEALQSPRASHYSLAAWLGSAVSARLESSGDDVRFNAGFYTDGVLDELVSTVLARQREYAGRAAEIGSKIERYKRLLAIATHEEPEKLRSDARHPAFVLAPYFAVRDFHADPWWGVNQRIWTRCVNSAGRSISPVIAVAGVDLLENALASLPTGLDGHRFFWVTDFDERRANHRELAVLWETVRSYRGQPLVNLYGGFFSACMAHVRLYGFSNGLGYSESRAWPHLTYTGAAPPRYYIRDLHMYAAPGVAQLLVEAEPSFACNCSACSTSSIISLNYHLLKRHFALARQWELDLVDRLQVTEIAEHLKDASERFRSARRMLPVVPLNAGHLDTWAEVLSGVG
jgi:hypothetical protein